MGTRNFVWARQQTAGGPIEKLLLLHIADAIGDNAKPPILDTSLGFLAGYCEATLFQIHAALEKLAAAKLILIDRSGERLLLRIAFPQI